MNVDDEFSKFTSSLNKFINKQWSKVRSSTSSLISAKNLDQVLEQEYETLLREIDYITTEKSCYLNFKNDHFNNTKSSEDLTKILRKHSEEVLKTYITQHDKAVKKDTLDNRNDLINYVTEIIVSRPKCNNKVCTCKPVKSTKEVFTDSVVPKENGKGTQTGRGKSTEKIASTQISNNAIVKKVNIEVQTDDWNHDRNCTCGCCPKTKSQISTKTVSTEEKQLKDATTSDKKITSSKSVLADCVGNKVEAHTSTIKLCVPENFETLLSNEANNKFSTCTGKRDCACDAYDVKEAIKRGLVLPSSEICIQPKKDKKKSSKNDKKYETSSEIVSSDESASKKEKKKTKEKEKIKNKEKKKKESESSSSSSSSTTPREKPKKKKTGNTGCFGSKKKNRECDEYCQGIVKRERSIQTMSIRTNDKSEEAYESSENDRKTIETSTKSEKGIQLNSKVDLTKEDTHDKEVSLKENKETGRSRVFIDNKKSKPEKDTYTREQDNQEKPKEVNICNKCGRQKRDCNSGCRNTFIIPYASGSNGAIPPGDAESLRMLIKMQSKDTSRQFDNVMAELNHQKSEIKRLNDMYLKMLTSFSDSQKLAGSSKSNSNYYSNKSRESSKPCGCSFSNECKISNKHNTPTEKSNNNSNNACACSFNSNNTSNGPVRRFGPPNTAVAINMCDTCTVEIGGSSNVRNGSCVRDCDYFDGDKQRKEQLNLSKKKGQNLVSKSDNFGKKGDSSSHKTDSVSTIYKNNKQNINLKKGANITKKNGYENLRADEDTLSKEAEDEYSQNILPAKDTTDLDTETDASEPNKKPRKMHSSRVLIWLKRSWITIRNKTEQCRQKDKERREEAKIMKHVLNLCQKGTKQVASNMWKSMKKWKFRT